MQHSITVAFFPFRSYLLWNTSQLLCYYISAKRLNTLTPRNAHWPVVQKLSALVLRGASLLLFASVEDIHYWRPEELVPFSYQIILYTIALKLYLALRCVLTWWNHSFLQDRALFISNAAPELQWDGIPSSCQSYLILMASQNSCFVSWVSSLVNSKPLFD